MKNKLPVFSKKSNFIKFNRTVLNNGIRIITEETPLSDTFALGITINAGSRDDFENYTGLAHFLEHAAFRRSKKYNSSQIANKFESMGAYTNAYTTQELTCFYVRALNTHFKKCLNLLLEIVFNPAFKRSELEKEKQIIIEETKSYEDDPEELILDLGDKLIFGEHPLGYPILGLSDTVMNIDEPVLQDFHQKYYNAANTTVSFSGNIEHKTIVAEIQKAQDKIQNNNISLPERISPVYNSIKIFETKKSVQQGHLLLGKPVSSSRDLTKYAFSLLNIIFGDGLSSRLYQNLRDKYGITYSIYSTLQLYSDSGIFYIYSATDKRNIDKTRNLILQEIDKLSVIKDSELKRAKEQFKTGLIMDLESLSSRMQTLAKAELIDGYHETSKEISDRIDNVTKDDIYKILDNYFINTDTYQTTIIPEKKCNSR